jgi:hypothetical protein
MAKRKTTNYVNNKDFYQELVRYNQQIGEKKISNYIGECFMLIASNLAKKPCFNRYSFLEEMIGDGIENCIQAVNSFSVDKTENPFAYFTQITYYAFIRRIHYEKKQQYIKHKNVEQYYLHGKLDDVAGNELSDIVIDEFEKKNMTKKKKVANTSVEELLKRKGK